MALFDKLSGTTESAPAKTEREEKLQKLIREGNEYMRQHQDDNYAVLMQKEAEIEEACKKLHGYFYKEPDVQIILKERQEMYQMEEGTRYSVDKKGNRILNYQGE